MDTDRRRFLSSQNQREYRYTQQYERRDIYPAYYSYENLWDRLTNPAFILSAIVLASAILYQLGLQQGRIQPLPGLVWDLVVSITPARLLYLVDSWVNPPLFPQPPKPGPLPCDNAAKSELLKKILGINTNAAPSNVIGSWVNSLATKASKPASSGPPGLGNPLYECFRNSVLQSLATWGPYIEYLEKSSAGISTRERTRPQILCEFLNTLRGKSTRGTMVVPKKIAFKDRFGSFSQHDAHEYYLQLIDSIDEDLTRMTPDRSRSGKNPVEGLIADRVSCTTCGHYDSIRLNLFKTLDLTLDGKETPQSLSSCLDRYTTMEALTDLNCNYCTLVENLKVLAGKTDEESKSLFGQVKKALEDEKLDDEYIKGLVTSNHLEMQKRTKTKQTAIARPPPLLAIHIERSIHYLSGAQAKNRAKVLVPIELDLGPWLLGSADKTRAKDSSDAEEWIIDPYSSMAARSRGRSKLSGPMYRLTAIVFHKGATLNSGHYLALRKHQPSPLPDDDGLTEEEEKPVPPTWFVVSDETVVPIQSETVEEEIENRWEDVHMLFYERVDPTSVLLEDEPEPATTAALADPSEETTEVGKAEEEVLEASSKL